MSVNVAVVGAGHWGRNLVRNFAELGSLRVVCDPNDVGVRPLVERFPGVRYVPTLDEVLADPSVQAVALATPAASHAELGSRCLAYGKDLFVEKPLAMSVVEGERIVAQARASDRIIMVGHVLRYHPAVLALQKLVADGALGRIQYVYSNRLNIGKIRTEENILWSFAPHDISVLLALLGEQPAEVSCLAADSLGRHVPDVTVSQFVFPSGVQGHIFVSWLHPFKEQRLVVVGSQRMAVFDDTAEHKLLLYPHRVEWKNRIPTAVRVDPEVVPLATDEPLRAECQHFLDCVAARSTPRTDGSEGLAVLRVLDACQRSLEGRGVMLPLQQPSRQYFAHPSATVDDAAEIGEGTKIWHYAHVMGGARIGRGCIFGQNTHVASDVVLGDNVKVQNNVSIYSGTIIEDDVFLGPSCVLTNVTNPRSQVVRHAVYERTVLRRGATVGANATIVCGVTVGRYAFIAAGAVVTRDIADYALVAGIPARQVGWMSRHGQRLGEPNAEGVMRCPESGYRYRLDARGCLHCLDLDEEQRLPPEQARGVRPYRDFAPRCGTT
jgi:UDP-2-acetamido-3-amino-2,3-dideoxy-glucuronate N-acetyltransferase